VDAVAVARTLQPHLVLMDIRLPGEIDGIEAACRIHHEMNIPVVFLTAFADCTTLERAKAAEPCAYLLKPFDEVLLAATVEIAINKHRVHELLLRVSREAASRHETQFQCMAASSEYAVQLLDTEGRILTWNQGSERIHGWQAGEVLGRSHSILYPDKDVRGHQPGRDLASAVRSEKLGCYRCLVRKGGSQFHAETVLLMMRNSEGTSAGFLRIARELAPGPFPN
jgi:PAS domain S-box-containing protein